MVDIGELICTPFLKWIPDCVKPNTITVTNHLMNWALMLVCSQTESATGMLVASSINFVCMMLDCLDGMHARATGQSSQYGEMLDHVFDAAHIPMVAASAAMLLKLTPWSCAFTIGMISAVYCAQVLHFRYMGEFVSAPGVESQIALSVMMAGAAYARIYGLLWYAEYVSYVVPFLALGVMHYYVKQFTLMATLEFIEFNAAQILISTLYIMYDIPQILFSISMSIVAFVYIGKRIVLGVEKRDSVK